MARVTSATGTPPTRWGKTSRPDSDRIGEWQSTNFPTRHKATKSTTPVFRRARDSSQTVPADGRKDTNCTLRHAGSLTRIKTRARSWIPKVPARYRPQRYKNWRKMHTACSLVNDLNGAADACNRNCRKSTTPTCRASRLWSYRAVKWNPIEADTETKTVRP